MNKIRYDANKQNKKGLKAMNNELINDFIRNLNETEAKMTELESMLEDLQTDAGQIAELYPNDASEAIEQDMYDLFDELSNDIYRYQISFNQFKSNYKEEL